MAKLAQARKLDARVAVLEDHVRRLVGRVLALESEKADTAFADADSAEAAGSEPTARPVKRTPAKKTQR